MLNFNDLTEEQKQKVDKDSIKINELSCKYRGKIVEHFCMFESVMELAIAEYFTSCNPLKTTQLVYGMLAQEGFNFHNKRKLIVFIAENAFPQFYKKHKKLDSEITDANSFRNLVVHRKLDITPETVLNFDGENITLYAFTTRANVIKPVPKIINQEKIDEEVRRLNLLANSMAELRQLIRKP